MGNDRESEYDLHTKGHSWDYSDFVAEKKPTHKLLSECADMVEKQILEQLKWLVSRGILVVENRKTQTAQRSDGGIDFVNFIELKSKEHEYIKKLEAEKAELERKLGCFKTAMFDAFRNLHGEDLADYDFDEVKETDYAGREIKFGDNAE